MVKPPTHLWEGWFLLGVYVMVENIIEVVKDIQGWTLTLILMLLVFSDTFLALKTRVPMGQFLSKKLLMGSGYNMLLSSVPLVSQFMINSDFTNTSDDLVLRLVMVFMFAVGFLGIFGSCLVNYTLAYPNSEKALVFVKQFLPSELEEKTRRLDEKKVK